ncbi:MAG: hypothetical protein Q4B71_00425 [Cardiobacteriaceae bacterium]|nr:hypothetical protein [Cardiobacteriaceae bacterium]
MDKLQGRKYSGDLYGRKFGSQDGFEKLGNVSGLKTSTEIEQDVLKSTGADDYGQAISVEIKPSETKINLSFNSFNKDGLARALMGEAVDKAKSKQTVDKQSFTLPKAGFLKLEHQDIDPTTFELFDESDQKQDPDTYKLRAVLGMVELTEQSALTAGDAVKISYQTKERAGFSIDSNTLPKIELELLLEGKDRISGREGSLWIPHAVLSSAGDLDWFSDDWWENGMEGTLIKEDSKPTMRFTEYTE